MTEKHIDQELIAQIEAFLSATGMTPTAFGRQVANDSTLLVDLKLGREVRRETRNKIISFIAEQTQTSVTPEKKGARRLQPASYLRNLITSKTCSAKPSVTRKTARTNTPKVAAE